MATPSQLNFGIDYSDLYQRSGLLKLDRFFLNYLENINSELLENLMDLRSNPEQDKKKISEIILELSPILESFIVKLFDIHSAYKASHKHHKDFETLYKCKRNFIQRRVLKKFKEEDLILINKDNCTKKIESFLQHSFSEDVFSRKVTFWLEDEKLYQEQIDCAEQFAALYYYSNIDVHRKNKSILFDFPKKIDPLNRIALQTNRKDGNDFFEKNTAKCHSRTDFSLTDQGFNLSQTLDHTYYCIWCHKQNKDSCSQGLKQKKSDEFVNDVFNKALHGCPLEEKISEMNFAKSRGDIIGSLAIAIIDNPMVAATGHRICNDCMKACIYQKQEPVNIPQIETKVLKDILKFPFGFEIYSLLTRWNPLNFKTPYPKENTGKTILVVGMGPAGFTLAHYLMNEGHHVIAIDGLKIEPLDEIYKKTKEPIQDISTLYENLDDRVIGGFGGVAEYGITVRWDKNFLKIIRLLLERRKEFQLHGGVRFGGTISIKQAFENGVDHIALCVGAGKPRLINVPNQLANGVRQASDFLMALQLTGAAKKDSLANLQIQLPAIVIGGGLTAIDTATEVLAYYPRQVEKFYQRYLKLVSTYGKEDVEKDWSKKDKNIAEIYIAHALELQKEKNQAKLEKRTVNYLPLLKKWGGVKIAYRRRLMDSPSYTLNPEEVDKAFDEGIEFMECSIPKQIIVDETNSVERIEFIKSEIDENGHFSTTDKIFALKAKTILVAAGTQANIVVSKEEPEFFTIKDNQLCPDMDGDLSKEDMVYLKKRNVPFFLNRKSQNSISYFGDLHPIYSGNVVKAMASAKDGYPHISELLKSASSKSKPDIVSAFFKKNFEARVEYINRLTPTIIEVVAHAPLAAKNFQPGQFYRLQNFESFAAHKKETKLAMEGLAMTGAWVDRDKGLISTIVLEMGGSSNLCQSLEKGDPIILMGPTGTPTEIPSGETILLVGGGLGNAVLFSIGKALKQAGSKVLYFAGYKKVEDRYKQKWLEEASDQLVWCCDEKPGFTTDDMRKSDHNFVGNIVEAMKEFADGKLGAQKIKLSDVDRMIVIGSDKMMKAVHQSRTSILKPYLKKNHKAVGSINSPMQCMMKEICAQCLQRHVDPITGKETVVYSCMNQDQDMNKVDFDSLSTRLSQNSVQEKLTAKWIEYCDQSDIELEKVS